MRRTLSLLPLLVALAVLTTALPVAARTNIAIGVSNPDGGGPGLAAVQATVAAHIAEVGRKPAMWSLWSKWGDRGADSNGPCVAGGNRSCAFPTEAVDWLLKQNITPVIWWLPVDPKDPNGNRRYGQYGKIVKGKHGAYVKQWATDLKMVSKANNGKPVIVRFAHEASGHWFPWSIGRGQNTKKNYKKAWKYLDIKFKAMGADPYTRWLWANVKPYQQYYPGNFIDYVGITVLNFGSDRKWQNPKTIIDNRAGMSPKYTKKPIIIAEIATHYEGGNKGTWIEKAYLRAWYKHPKVKGIMYLDTDDPMEQRGHPDWRLVADNQKVASTGVGVGLTAYKKLAQKSKFKGKIK